MSGTPITCLNCGNSIAGVNPRHQAAAVVCPYCGNQIALQRTGGNRLDLGMLVLGGAALMLVGAIGCVLGIWFLIATFNRGPAPPEPAKPRIAESPSVPTETDDPTTMDDYTPPPIAPSPSAPIYPRPDATTRIEPASDSGLNQVDGEPLTVAPLAIAEAALRYQWKPEETYRYRVSVKFESAGREETLHATTTYRMGQADVRDPSFAKYLQTGQSNGTGFVVHRDGYLLTCAHVVLGATEVRVELGGQSYRGEVVALDKEHDLAVVHIDRRGLRPLPLGNSDYLQLAEEVHVVGYPLANVLGESIKANRGQLAGIIGQGTGKVFQLDAAVNRGNSGGPVFNRYGEVMGVATAVLVGEGVNQVGFAVPSAEARRLLATKGIPFATDRDLQEIPATELMQRVTPSVAMLKVTTGPNGIGSAERYALMCQTNFHAFDSPTNTQLGRFLEGIYQKAPSATARLLTDEYGEVLASHETPPLPFLLGPPERLLLQHLDPKGQDSWTTQRVLSLSRVAPLAEATELERFAGARFFHEVPTDDPFFGQSDTAASQITAVPLAERSRYRMESKSADRAVIGLQYELKSVSDKGISGVSDLAITAHGQFTFDAVRGIPERLSFRADYREIKSRRPVQMSMTVDCVLDEGAVADGAASTTTADPTGVASTGTRGPPAGYTPPTDPEKRVRYLLEVLRERKSDELVHHALIDLRRMEPLESRRAEVASLIELYLSRSEILQPSSHLAALVAIGVWGDKSNAARLRAAWDADASVATRQAVVVGLARIQAIDELLELLDEDTDAERAKFTRETLIALGSEAEPSAIALARHKSPSAKLQGLLVLRRIGGQKTADNWTAIDARLPGDETFLEAKLQLINDIRSRLQAGEFHIAPNLPLLFPSES